MKQKMKSNKGITLIALVITIIVLLILAAVTIATLTGENGILTKATTAKENTETEEEKEQIRLAYATALANDPNKLSVSAEELQKELEKLTSIEKIEGEEYFLTVQFTKTGNKYGIDGDGGITPIGKGEATQKPEKEEVKEVEYSDLKVGDYVNYPVYYDNVHSYYHNPKNRGFNTPEDQYNSWRILSVDPETKIVRLVSAGIPLNYNNGAGEENIFITNLITNFFNTAISTETLTLNTFYQCGFKNAKNGTPITTIGNLKNLFVTGDASKLTEVNDGNPSVQAMTTTDFESVWESRFSFNINVTENNLLAIPCKDLTEQQLQKKELYSAYFLPLTSDFSCDDTQRYKCGVGLAGNTGSYMYTLGVRPVVTLKANVKFTPAEKKTDGTQIYNVSI